MIVEFCEILKGFSYDENEFSLRKIFLNINSIVYIVPDVGLKKRHQVKPLVEKLNRNVEFFRVGVLYSQHGKEFSIADHESNILEKINCLLAQD